MEKLTIGVQTLERMNVGSSQTQRLSQQRLRR